MPFDIHDGRTTGIYEEVIRCEDIEDVHQLLRDNASLMTDYADFCVGRNQEGLFWLHTRIIRITSSLFLAESLPISWC